MTHRTVIEDDIADALKGADKRRYRITVHSLDAIEMTRDGKPFTQLTRDDLFALRVQVERAIATAQMMEGREEW